MSSAQPTDNTTRDELLKLRATQTEDSYIASSKGDPVPNRVVIGGAIAGPGLDHPSVLIVQRSAHERMFANEWEIPGGHVDPGETILETVAREIREETALEVTEVVCEFDKLYYWTTKYEEDETNDNTDSSRSICTHQLNFCAQVKSTESIKLNPDEHQKYAWCTLETVEQFKITKDMCTVVINALNALETASKQE